jgi:hypothetical protein
MHFSLRSLLLALAYVGLFCASLLAAQEIWTQLFLLVTFLVVMFAAILALFGASDRRPMRGGFAIAAAAYLALTLYPGNFTGFPTTSLAEWLNGELRFTRERLWTTPADAPSTGGALGAATLSRAQLPASDISIPSSGYINWTLSSLSPRVALLINAAQPNTHRLVHCLAAMLLGLIAAEVARRAQRNAQLSATAQS